MDHISKMMRSMAITKINSTRSMMKGFSQAAGRGEDFRFRAAGQEAEDFHSQAEVLVVSLVDSQVAGDSREDLLQDSSKAAGHRHHLLHPSFHRKHRHQPLQLTRAESEDAFTATHMFG